MMADDNSYWAKPQTDLSVTEIKPMVWHNVLDKLLPERPIGSEIKPEEKSEGYVQYWREWNAQSRCAIWNKTYLDGGELEAFNQWESVLLAKLSDLKVPYTYRAEKTVRIGTLMSLNNSEKQNVRHLINTRNAGPTLYDWLRMPVQSNGQTRCSFLVSPENYLKLALSLLRALDAIHTNNFVHCDLHAGNICLPAEILKPPVNGKVADIFNLNIQLDFEKLTLIDFGYSIDRQQLPPSTLPYDYGHGGIISPHLKNVLAQVESAALPRLKQNQHWETVRFDVGFWQRLDGSSPLELFKTIDWREDMFRLGRLLADIRDGVGEADHLGGRTFPPARQIEIDELIFELPEQLMRWGEGAGTDAPPKPHQGYINRIDSALTLASNCGEKTTTRFTISAVDYDEVQSPPGNSIPQRIASWIHSKLKRNKRPVNDGQPKNTFIRRSIGYLRHLPHVGASLLAKKLRQQADSFDAAVGNDLSGLSLTESVIYIAVIGVGFNLALDWLYAKTGWTLLYFISVFVAVMLLMLALVLFRKAWKCLAK